MKNIFLASAFQTSPAFSFYMVFLLLVLNKALLVPCIWKKDRNKRSTVQEFCPVCNTTETNSFLFTDLQMMLRPLSRIVPSFQNY